MNNTDRQNDTSVMLGIGDVEAYADKQAIAALAAYDPQNRIYSAYLNFNGNAPTLDIETIESWGQTAQNNIESLLSANDAIRQQVNCDDLIGMIYQCIANNINTEYKLQFNNFGEQRNKNITLKKAKALIEDFNKQINIHAIIREAIEIAYLEGNYFCILRNYDTNWEVDYIPLGVGEMAGYRANGEPVLLVNVNKLKTALSKTYKKTKSGKALLYEDLDRDIKATYPDEVYKAYKNGERYAVIPTEYSGVVRVNNFGRAYGLSPLFRGLEDQVMLDNFRNADEACAKAKAKKIIHQKLRSQVLGADGSRKGFDVMAYAHSQLMTAFKNNTVVYTSPAAVEAVEYVEPKVEDVSVEKINFYRTKVLTSLGVAFMAPSTQITSTVAALNLKQLMRQIDRISEQVGHMLEQFYATLLDVNGIGLEYVPTITVMNAELMETSTRVELAKLLYSTFSASRATTFKLAGIDLTDEKLKREDENKEKLDEVFIPYGTSYTKSADDGGDAGRPAGTGDDVDLDKQSDDKGNNEVKE